MSLKFGKDRSVEEGYTMIPMYYTGIKSPRNNDKELVIMDQLGKNYQAAWRNNKTNKVGITFLLQVVEGGFRFKDNNVLFKNCNKVW